MLNMSDNKTKSLGYSTTPLSSVNNWRFRYDFAKGLSYDNTYPSIKAISNAFINIIPYAIDANGEPMQDVRLLNVLAHPNQAMSGADFREALATMALVHRKVYLLVWRAENGRAIAGGRITPENVTGFTFLEDASTIESERGKVYRLPDGTTFSDKEVIEISAGVDPYNVEGGYSPSVAVKKWSNVDDYIANYQAGYFENGAVPAGQFIITAPSVDAFNDIVDSMEAKHRGSGQNNNVIYTHRPVGADGSAVTEQVQWIPFSQPNNSLDLSTVFKEVNDKIDSAFGVPSSIRGVNDKNTYASVKVDERVFIEYTVRPFATKIWSRFTHEMNRITGGLGYVLKFDLESPNVADEEKMDAERKKVELDLIIEARNAGFTLDSIVDAFDLSNAYKTLEMGDSNETEIENDKPEVDEGGEVAETPNGASNAPKALCHECEHEHIVAKDVNHDNRTESDMAKVARETMESQIEATIKLNAQSEKDVSAIGLEEYDENGDGVLDDEELAQLENYQIAEPTKEGNKAFTMAMLAIAIALMLKRGKKEQATVLLQLQEAGASLPDEVEDYVVGLPAETSYADHLSSVAESFMSDTVAKMREIVAETIARASEEGRVATKNEIADNLRGILKTDEWRIERIARTEEHRANQLAQIDSIIALQHQTNARIYKTWHRNPTSNSCEFCIAMDGKREPVDKSFVPLGGVIEGEDGGLMANLYQDIEGAYAHPNCQCYLTFDVEKA